jgi:hypothetical protein
MRRKTIGYGFKLKKEMINEVPNEYGRSIRDIFANRDVATRAAIAVLEEYPWCSFHIYKVMIEVEDKSVEA